MAIFSFPHVARLSFRLSPNKTKQNRTSFSILRFSFQNQTFCFRLHFHCRCFFFVTSTTFILTHSNQSPFLSLRLHYHSALQPQPSFELLSVSTHNNQYPLCVFFFLYYRTSISLSFLNIPSPPRHRARNVLFLPDASYFIRVGRSAHSCSSGKPSSSFLSLSLSV